AALAGRQSVALVAQLAFGLGYPIDSLVKLAQETGNVALLRGQRLPGGVDQALGHPEAARDLEPGGLARRAEAQNISRLERIFVEAHRTVQYTLGIRAINLEREQMRGGESKCPGAAEGIENRDAERTSFFGIGGAAELVEQHQRIARHVEEH